MVLATFAKFVVILKLGLRNISKRIETLVFLNMYTPPTTPCLELYNFLSFKIIYKDNSKFDLKIKGALDINWKKLKLNARQNDLAPTLSLKLALPLCSFQSLLFYLSLLYIILITSENNYQHLLLSYLHFAIISSQYNTP